MKEMAYVAADCVAAGLVRTLAMWPGAKVLVDDIGRRVVEVKRPNLDRSRWGRPRSRTLSSVVATMVGSRPVSDVPSGGSSPSAALPPVVG